MTPLRPSVITCLAHGPFTERPALAFAMILLLFGLAGAIAPDAAMVLGA